MPLLKVQREDLLDIVKHLAYLFEQKRSHTDIATDMSNMINALLEQTYGRTRMGINTVRISGGDVGTIQVALGPSPTLVALHEHDEEEPLTHIILTAAEKKQLIEALGGIG